MGRVPDVIVIARHGARLDAADKTWHLTSPTPYDPPLTYGGWTQSRALGTRIASLLHAHRQAQSHDDHDAHDADDEHDPHDHTHSGQRRPSTGSIRARPQRSRKQKIVVHSSPFLRCVQTSIAVAAGIAQYRPNEPRRRDRSGSPLSRQRVQLRSLSPTVRVDPALSPIAEPDEYFSRAAVRTSLNLDPLPKTKLRIDAFLGEWLSPDYFELITPPPNSTMMVAGAKADLLRRGEYIEVPQTDSLGSNNGHFPGGWAKSNIGTTATTSTHTNSSSSPHAGLGSLAQVLPLRDRSSSHGSVGSVGSRSSHRGTPSISASLKNDRGAYVAPVPTYAISPSDPIPRGYVAHARDACVEVDYQWDSMREPQEWGDGGEYGEEWSAMHKRFRKGVNEMINWYKGHGTNAHTVPNGSGYHGNGNPADKAIEDSSDEESDSDAELVLVLVTHGAGCNALIGALTHQPVLLDVGMASLTMAVRKEQSPTTENIHPASSPTSPGGNNASPDFRRSSTIDNGPQEHYEMRMIASTEHLRPGIDPARINQPSAPRINTGVPEYRRRMGSQVSANSPIDSPFGFSEPGRGVNSSLGSIRRSSLSSPITARMYSSITVPRNNNGATGLTGLWSKTGVPSMDGGRDDPSSPAGGDFLLNFHDSTSLGSLSKFENNIASPAGSTPTTPAATATPTAAAPAPVPLNRTLSQHGLWGSATSASGAMTERERGLKRRWTITERNGP